MVQSETYTVLDCIVYDTGVTGTYNQNCWVKQYQAIEVEVTANGTSILGGGNGQGYLCNKPSTTTSDLYDWDNNICIEFDVYDITGDPYIQIRDSDNNSASVYLATKGAVAGSHVKITVGDASASNNVNIVVDDATKTPVSLNNTGLLRVGFILGTTYGLTFKNWKIYPI